MGLRAIDLRPFATTSSSARIFEELCGAVRDSVLVPVYVAHDPPKTLMELGMHSVAVSEGLAKKIIEAGGKAIVEGADGRLEIKEGLPSGNICREFLSKKLLALYFPQGYSREYGLVI
jgi:hypothetical protein